MRLFDFARYKQHIQAGGGDRIGNNAAMIRGNAPFISPGWIDFGWSDQKRRSHVCKIDQP